MSALLAPDIGSRSPVEIGLKFDRRNSPRVPVEGFAMVAFGDAESARLTPVQLIDASDGGLGVRSSRPIFPGTPFSLFCNGSSAVSFAGEVTRCSSSDDGYTIGLCYSPLMAA